MTQNAARWGPRGFVRGLGYAAGSVYHCGILVKANGAAYLLYNCGDRDDNGTMWDYAHNFLRIAEEGFRSEHLRGSCYAVCHRCYHHPKTQLQLLAAVKV